MRGIMHRRGCAGATLVRMQATVSDSLSAQPPRRLNLREFAQRGAALQGSVAVSDLPRLAASLHADAAQLRQLQVHWSLQGMLRPQPGGGEHALVRLHVRGALPMTCQRCLQAAQQDIDDEAMLRLVDDEPEIDAEELESVEEAFCARHPVDVLELIEDQLILALPLVPMHAACPQPLARPHEAAQDAAAAASPFAVLAALRGKPD